MDLRHSKVEKQEDGSVRVVLQVTGQQEEGWQCGDEVLWPAGTENVTYILFRRFFDLTTTSFIKEYQRIDAGDSSLFLDLLQDPVKSWTMDAQQAREEVEKVSALLDRLQHSKSLGESQFEALRDHILQSRLSCIWGPPGAGKTHSIAIYILFLCYAHQCQ